MLLILKPLPKCHFILTWFCFSLLGYKHLHYGFKTVLLKFIITHFGKWNFHLILLENIIFVHPKLFFFILDKSYNKVEIQKQVKNTKNNETKSSRSISGGEGMCGVCWAGKLQLELLNERRIYFQ